MNRNCLPWKALCLILALAMLAPALHPVRGDAAEQAVLRVAIKPLASTNPLTADAESMRVLGLIYDTATKINPETGERLPYIAVGSANASMNTHNMTWADCTVGKFGYSPKGLWEDPGKPEMTVFYDFGGVRWHDGVQMGIRDILFSFHAWAYTQDEWLGHPLADKAGLSGSNYTDTRWLFIRNVWESEDGTRAALKFTLQKPYFNVFDSYLSAFILPYHIWAGEASNQTMNNTMIWCDPGYNSSDQYSWKLYFAKKFTNPNPVGSGPFIWAGSTGDKITLRAWAGHFYKPGSRYYSYGSGIASEPKIDAITLKPYMSEEQAIMDLGADRIDLIAWDMPSAVSRFAGSEDVGMESLRSVTLTQLAFNMRRRSFGYDRDYGSTSFADIDYGKPLRKALAHCIDSVAVNAIVNTAVPDPAPLSAFGTWKNLTAPAYAFDPSAAMSILNNTGYMPTDPELPAGEGNWRLNPDRTQIGSLPTGAVELLVPDTASDPAMYQAGLMLANQMRAVGINTELAQTDPATLAARLDQRDFDMCIIERELAPGERAHPETLYYELFHTDMALNGPNFCGYGNASFDRNLELAMAATDHLAELKSVQDSESSVAYDLPMCPLYHECPTEFYRADNFDGFADDGSGSLLNSLSMTRVMKQQKAMLRAKFMGLSMTGLSNSTRTVTVKVTDLNGNAMQGADLVLGASAGFLLNLTGKTDEYGMFSANYTAPYVPLTEAYGNSMAVKISVKSATLAGYRPALPVEFTVTVFPERMRTLFIEASADPDTITAMDSSGNQGFSHINIRVRDGANMPVDGAVLRIRAGDSNITLSAPEARTDDGGSATLTVYAAEVMETAECNITINATKGGFRNATQVVWLTVLPYVQGAEEPGMPLTETLALPAIIIIGMMALAGTIYRLRKGRRRK